MAIAADDGDHTAELQQKLDGVMLLRDEPSLDATAAWGLKIGDAEAPWPATYVIDAHGTIAWRHLRDAKGDWPAYSEVEAALSQAQK